MNEPNPFDYAEYAYAPISRKGDKEWLLSELRRLGLVRDPEEAHPEADACLIAYIGDPEIEAAYDGVDKWYA